jgi:CubicO group peptidase (beta-lactamase class C family)
VVAGDGAVVVDHTAGTTDGISPWRPDTLVMTYSVAKPFAALVVLDAVAQGALGLDQPVAEVWPSYAAHGKGATTVRQVLSHGAGLPCFPAAAAEVAFDDREALTGLLAAAGPEHEPGTAVAEHALTYGHLCDELVRRSTGSDLAERFAGIAGVHGWDLHLRVGEADLARVADVVTLGSWPEDYLADAAWGPALSRPTGLFDPAVLNSTRFRTTSFPAVALHASARGLATFYADLTRPDGAVAALLGPELHAAYLTAQATGVDRVIGQHVAWTLGLQVDADDLGMGGAGGCSAWWSLRHEYAAAYVSRGLGELERVDDIYSAIESALP